MRVYHYLICWIITLCAGIMVAAAITDNLKFGMAFGLISGLLSLPFILLFLALMGIHLNQKPEKNSLHIYTFLWHIGGSTFTYLILALIEPREALLLLGIIGGYFAFDSLLFHLTIELMAVNQTPVSSDDDVLDDLL